MSVLSDCLDLLIGAARAEFGETEYQYFRVPVYWHKCRRQPGYHTAGTKVEISKEEYEASEADSKKARTDAFMGRLQGNYSRVEREISKEGWKEHLLKIIADA